MAGSDDIVQNIVLAGQAEVIAGFAAISAAGVAAFDGISRAATATSLSGVAGGFLEITGAVATATAGLFAFVQASAQSTAVIQRLATTEGVTLETMSSFVGALSATGASVDGLTAAFKRFAVQVSLQFPTVAKEVRNAANQMQGDFLRVAQANLSLTSSMLKASFQDRDATQLRQQNIKSLAQAQLGLAEATERRIALETGQPTPPGIQQELNFEKALLAEEQARLDVQDAIKKKQEDAAQAPIKALQAQLDVAEKAQQAESARLKFLEDQGNNILNIKKFIDDTAAGIRSDSSGLILSEQNIVKGLIASVGPAVNSVTQIQGAIGDFGASAPKMFPTLLKLADLFKNLGDETTKQAVAVALFGRGFNVSLIESLSLGSGAIQGIADKFKDLGFVLTSVEEKGKQSDEFLEKNFRQTFGLLAAEINIVSKQFANLFSPLFTPILSALSGALEANRQTIIDWGTSIRDAALPPLVALIHLITGGIPGGIQLSPEQLVDVAAWEATFTNIYNTIVSWGSKVKNFLLNTLPAAFNFVMGLLDRLADGINKIFGTQLTGTDLGIGFLIGQFTGLNNVILTLIGNLPLAAAAFLGVFGPGGAIAAGVIALAGLLAVLWLDIQKNSTDAAGNVKTTWQKVFSSDLLFGPKGVKSAWQDFIDVVEKDKKGTFSNWEIFIDTAKAVAQFDPLKAAVQALRKSMDISDVSAKDVEALGLIDGGWSAIQKTAEGAGATQKKATDDAVDAAKRLESEVKKVKDAYESGDTSARKLSSTMAGAGAQGFLKNVPAQFQGLVEGTQAAADKFGQSIGQMIVKVDQFASSISNAGGTVNSQLNQVLGKSSNIMDQAASSATGMALKIGKGWSQLVIDVQKYLDAVKSAQKQSGSVQPLVGGPQIISVPDTMRLIEERMRKLRETTSSGFLDPSGMSITQKDLDEIDKKLGDTQKKLEELGKGEGAGTGAFDQMDESLDALIEKIKKVPEEVQHSDQSIKGGFEGAATAAGRLDASFQSLEGPAQTIRDDFSQMGTPAQQVAQGFQALGATSGAVSSLSGSVSTLSESVTTLVQSGLATLQSTGGQAFDAVGTAASTAAGAVQSAVSQMISALDQLISKLQQAQSAESSLSSAAGSGGGAGGQQLVFATGGLVRGKPGRDQNLAWLSDYEYVLRPEATISLINRYGRSFLDLINATGRLPEFSAGGLVNGLSRSLAAGMKVGIPAYASGGLNVGSSGGGKVTVHLRAGNQSLGSVTASRGVADNLARLASHARIVAAGKSPDWYS